MQSYIDALDTYGMIFDESAPTVGDLREGVDPLLEAGEQARAAGEDLAEAIEIQDAEVAAAEEEAAGRRRGSCRGG